MVTDGLNPFTLLAFLGAVAATSAGVVAIAVALYLKRSGLAKRLALWGGGTWVAYLALLLGASLASHDRLLAPHDEKHICEVDCHLAYSVAGVTTSPAPAGGRRYVVTVRVRFDEQTISSRRPRSMPLSPNSRYVALVDAAGRHYPGATNGLQRHLIPGEWYTTDIPFDVPSDATNLHLVLRSDDPETPFLIGHENSFFHGRTIFALQSDGPGPGGASRLDE